MKSKEQIRKKSSPFKNNYLITNFYVFNLRVSENYNKAKKFSRI